MKSEKIDLIIPALLKAQGELEHAKKDSINPHFKSKYADLATVLDTCKPVLQANDLLVTHQRESTEAGEFLITTLWHKSTQFLSSRSKLLPTKADPQGFGSAMTYARRYDLSALIGLAPDDDDGNAASQGKYTPPKPNGIVTNEQAVEIDILMRKVGADKTKFLEVLKAESVETIPAASYSVAIELLNKKAAKNG